MLLAVFFEFVLNEDLTCTARPEDECQPFGSKENSGLLDGERDGLIAANECSPLLSA